VPVSLVAVRHNLEPGGNGAPAPAGTAAAADEATESDDELEGGSSANWSPERRTAEELVGSAAWQTGKCCTDPCLKLCCRQHLGQLYCGWLVGALFRTGRAEGQQ
jgi:hypothetical protein